MNTIGMIEQCFPKLICLTLKQNSSLRIHDWIERGVIEDSETKAIFMMTMKTMICTSSNFANISDSVCQHDRAKTIPS